MLIPVGTVCAFAGQVNPVSGSPNNVWDISNCRSNNPQPGKLSDKAPLNYLEAQGWMLCDGRFLSTDTYPELFAALGYLYGKGTDSNGKETFRLPDYRGLFLRGFDAGAGMDPQAAERTSPTGNSMMNVVGSLQCDALQDHTHNYDLVQPSGISQQGQAAGTSVTSKPTTSPNTPASFGPETRPKNIAVNYIIKYR
ncbi:phage tail protein [Okeania sp. SIO2B3]|uniref:phage tail protein n=1 Tax=Okeania sp. SIO2B3 TaxID=2607784 RepID=UPI0013C0564D|nr:phage tail protein [Okeania sp. SIO2B3]NET46623.1 tail fiber protein [Okeania sp. SIO2B3]